MNFEAVTTPLKNSEMPKMLEIRNRQEVGNYSYKGTDGSVKHNSERVPFEILIDS